MILYPSHISFYIYYLFILKIYFKFIITILIEILQRLIFDIDTIIFDRHIFCLSAGFNMDCYSFRNRFN